MIINDPHTWRKSCLENSLTERTSTKSVLRLSLCIGSDVSTASVDRMDVHSRTTSGCSSQKSFASLPRITPNIKSKANELSARNHIKSPIQSINTYSYIEPTCEAAKAHLLPSMLKRFPNLRCWIGLFSISSFRIELINPGSYIL